MGGYRDNEIAALWAGKAIPKNVRLPQSFIEVIQTTSQQNTQPVQPQSNPLANLSALSAATARHMQKDITMAEVATQFIGRSAAPDPTPSSTRNYESAWGERANTGNYAPTDIVMVSGSGPWRGVSQVAIQQTFEMHYQPLLDQANAFGNSEAPAAQAQFVVGNAAGTDQLVQQYLQSHGYSLVWNSIDPSSAYLKATSPSNIATAIAVSNHSLDNPKKNIAGYCPSGGELLQWYQAYQVRAQTHPHDLQKVQQDQAGMAYVESIWLRQKTEGLQICHSSNTVPIYRNAKGKIMDVSANEFRNPAVVLTLEEHQRMQEAIQYLHQASNNHLQRPARSFGFTAANRDQQKSTGG